MKCYKALPNDWMIFYLLKHCFTIIMSDDQKLVVCFYHKRSEGLYNGPTSKVFTKKRHNVSKVGFCFALACENISEEPAQRRN